MYKFILYFLAFFFIIIFLIICFWNILNLYHKHCLKKYIDLEGYFERFNANDKKLRNNLTKAEYIKNARILYPWEIFKAPKTKYKILKLSPGIEFDFPHTHGKYIMTTNLNLSKDTIQHEEMHIFQRYHPAELSLFLQNRKHNIIGIIDPKKDNVRANPDTNIIIYDGYQNNADYVSQEVNNINDIKGDSIKEHPFEHIAYSM